MTGTNLLYVFLYNRDQLFLPNFQRQHGSAYNYIRFRRDEDAPRRNGSVSYTRDVEIVRRHWKLLNKPESPCSSPDKDAIGLLNCTNRCCPTNQSGPIPKAKP